MSRKNRNVSSESLDISTAQLAFIRRHVLRTRRIRIYQIVILIGFISLWEVTAHYGILNSFVFSSPSRVMKTIISMGASGQLFYHTGITLLETLVSFFLVNFLGIAVAVILWWNYSLSKVLEPYLIVLNSLPKSALAPVFIVWLGNNVKTIIVAAVSVAVFGTIINLYNDFKSVEEDRIKLIHTLGGNKRDVLFRVIIPSNIPSIISQMKVNIGLSLVGVVIGEFLAAKAGLGYLIIYGSQVFTCVYILVLFRLPLSIYLCLNRLIEI
ncbi:ABC transporter permease [Mobilitalea sibirica]|uniref:ABC transporter permease n=1 Tax=Mobilitalea sibirica TaxID=1462919 RepID=A0A8J7H1L0_9FIRM|nr:ABC transporter permease [Mobilitalea sibirica]MBH1940095.1 ABC transporter permease [Mobilitalea sibirica]